LPDTSKTHQPDIFYEIKKKMVSELKLQPLENGIDSFEFRLWAKLEIADLQQLYVIKKNENKWNCIHYIFKITHTGRPNISDIERLTSFKIVSQSAENIKPKTSWSEFFKKIEAENIYKLPSQGDIENFENIVNDGITYYVELADTSHYKFISYNCPDVYADKYEECQQFVNFLKIFNDEFGLKVGMNGEFLCK
jgi:hypothetical protein